jgi:hypothetical protein
MLYFCSDFTLFFYVDGGCQPPTSKERGLEAGGGLMPSTPFILQDVPADGGVSLRILAPFGSILAPEMVLCEPPF